MSDAFYRKIVDNIDQGPLTAPREGKEFSPAFLDYLKLLYTPAEAELVQHLKMGMKFTSAADLARLCGKSEEEVRAVLDPLAKKGRVIGFGANYSLPPVPLILNNHQFRDETGPDDVPAARLYQKFFIRDGFYKFYESSKQGTQIMRVIPVQPGAPGQPIPGAQPGPAGRPGAAPVSPEQAALNACISCLRQIDGAKQQWALEHQKVGSALMTQADLLPYFKGSAMPACPAGGIYSLNPVSVPPICNIPGHTIGR